MSMELWILSDKRLDSITQWQAVIDSEGYPLRLSQEKSFATLNGFLPSSLPDDLTGFECYHESAAEFVQDKPHFRFDRNWKYVLALRWLGSKWSESVAAWMAGTAYAQATDGIIVDDQEEKIRSAAEARDVVRRIYEAPELDIKSVVDELMPKLESELSKAEEILRQLKQS
jgi:hypothetical protein